MHGDDVRFISTNEQHPTLPTAALSYEADFQATAVSVVSMTPPFPLRRTPPVIL